MSVTVRRFGVALLCCLVAGAVLDTPAKSSRTGRTDLACKSRGATIAQNTRARVYAVRDGDLEIYACQLSPATRRSPTFIGLLRRTRGHSGFVLGGRFVGSIARGSGCGRGYCEEDQVDIANTRTGYTRRIAGEVFVLRSDGVAATLASGEGGQSVVRISDRNGLREAYRGAVIDRDSLAVSKNSVFWVSGGQTFREAAPGPHQ